MKRTIIVLPLVLLGCLLIYAASAVAGDQGRRLAGPFCVGKATNVPVLIDGTLVPQAGVVRSIAATQKCNPNELRKLGVAVPSSTTIVQGTPGAAGDAGAAGANGATGATGAKGATGEAGATGPAGPAGPRGYAGATGAMGATGATGPAGPAGKDGKDGKDGTVTGTIPVCASNGGNLKLCGGDNGHDLVGYLVLTGTNG